MVFKTLAPVLQPDPRFFGLRGVEAFDMLEAGLSLDGLKLWLLLVSLLVAGSGWSCTELRYGGWAVRLAVGDRDGDGLSISVLV
jgi:hypothetical protein